MALPLEENAGIPNSIPDTWLMLFVSVSTLKIFGLLPLICNLYPGFIVPIPTLPVL